jgi:hypothetical protein
MLIVDNANRRAFLVMLSVIMLIVKLFYYCNVVIRSGSTLLSFIILSVVMLHAFKAWLDE